MSDGALVGVRRRKTTYLPRAQCALDGAAEWSALTRSQIREEMMKFPPPWRGTRGIPTARGGAWTAVQVSDILRRAG